MKIKFFDFFIIATIIFFAAMSVCAAQGDFSPEKVRTDVDSGLKLARRIALIPGVDQNKLQAASERLRKYFAEYQANQKDRDKQNAVFSEIVQTKREIAFCNPKLREIDSILFVKRHEPEKNGKDTFHMCDQFYGFTNKSGGGLFVLQNPWDGKPGLKNLLENTVVQGGKMKGRKLVPGAFVSPEVSFDGKTIYFAYTEAKPSDSSWLDEKTVPYYHEWSETTAFHLFRCDADGKNLVQLTDGSTNDFDPCELPDGRIAFISERRGGFLRCGRYCPVFTLFSMNPDGSNIVCLSYHETHEWQPSVNHEGMLVYTRWDYVDRDTNIAHHLWSCFPDGRDPRSNHGNYPIKRESRPWMEMDIRAIPGSSKYVATAAAHHGFAFGSLVLIDPRIEDDNAMSQVSRLTPEIPFPEAEGKPEGNYMNYGTPWPLSEEDFLCVYDEIDFQNPEKVNRGIYWIDSDGNKELIYRDAEISCLSPMPLSARSRPPIIPVQTALRGMPGQDLSNEKGSVVVINVNESDFQWPEKTEVKELRIIQVLPKTTPTPNDPQIGRASQTNARAVLGTVPVENDGSVFFEAPVGVPLYFQAIGPDGRAIQSMRSATYLHPGEQLTCLGCHENKHRTPSKQISKTPLALQRPASMIRPEVDGSNPFNYVRLVQPVLDRHCVSCHGDSDGEKMADKSLHSFDLRGVPGSRNGWTRSYETLTKSHAFYFDVSNGAIRKKQVGGSRTVAGQFGAKAAALSPFLESTHYGVSLTPEERHRIDLWLDANSEFYGSYENTSDQSLGKIVKPTLE